MDSNMLESNHDQRLSKTLPCTPMERKVKPFKHNTFEIGTIYTYGSKLTGELHYIILWYLPLLTIQNYGML